MFSVLSQKQLTYLQEDNTTTKDSLIPIQKMKEPYRLQINDLLSIRVKAMDDELANIFNPVSETNPNATGEQRLYYDGFKVDAHGNIRIPILGDIYRDQATIMEAIGNSGDIPVTGDKRNVVIIRQYPLGQKVHHIDLTSIDAMSSPYYFIQPNDLIIINPLPQKSLGTGTTGLQSFTTIFSVLSVLTTTILLFIRL